MPPAFNLSQDQTLHLKSSISFCKVTQSTLTSPPPNQRSEGGVLASREHFSCLARVACQPANQLTASHPNDINATSASKAPTLIGCDLLKNEPRSIDLRSRRR